MTGSDSFCRFFGEAFVSNQPLDKYQAVRERGGLCDELVEALLLRGLLLVIKLLEDWTLICIDRETIPFKATKELSILAFNLFNTCFTSANRGKVYRNL